MYQTSPPTWLSVAKMTEAGLQLAFHGRHCVVRSKQGAVIAKAAKQDNRLYRISARAHASEETWSDSLSALTSSVIVADAASTQLAHQRMGRLHWNSLHQLHSQQHGQRVRNTIITARDVDFAEHIPGILLDHCQGNAIPVVPNERGQDTDASPVGHSARSTAPAPLLQQPIAVEDNHELGPNEEMESEYDSDSDSESHVSLGDTIPLSQLFASGGNIANTGLESELAQHPRRSPHHHAFNRAWDNQNQAHLALPSFAAFIRNEAQASSTATAFSSVTQLDHAEEPTSFDETTSSVDREQSLWEQAALDEMDSIQKGLPRLDVTDCKAVATPLATNVRLTNANSPLTPTAPEAAFITQIRMQSSSGSISQQWEDRCTQCWAPNPNLPSPSPC